MLFLIYTILVILQQYNGISTVVEDPCPSDIKDSTIVADMCSTNTATEDTSSGGDNVDSVVLRIMMQQDDCICRVAIENQIQTVHIGLRKYGGYANSVPWTYGCGLAVDINNIPDMSTGNETAPIECRENVDLRSFQLLQNSSLQFKSRIINGTFNRGYCMQIIRDSSSHNEQVLQIDCDAPMTTEQTTEQTIKSGPTTHTSGRTTGDTTTTDTQTDTYNDISPSITTTTDPTTSKTINTVNHDNAQSKGTEQTTYIAIGVGSGVALILLVVLVVICLRKKSTQKAGTNGNVNNSYQQEEIDDELQDNVLYVSAEEFDITGGNYSTAHEDMPRSSTNILGMEGNYSTVDDDTRKTSNNKISIDGDDSTVYDDTRSSSNDRLSVEGNYSTVNVDTPRSSNKRLSMDGNYNTVNVDTRKSSNDRLSVEGDYSTVDEDIPKSSNKGLSMDGNYSTVERDEQLERNWSYPENSEPRQPKSQQKPTIKPKPKSSCINSKENRSSYQNIKPITPTNGSDNVYAIVDKRSKNVPTTYVCKGEGTCQPDQTYAVVDKARKRKSSPNETNKKKFEINSGNRV